MLNLIHDNVGSNAEIENNRSNKIREIILILNAMFLPLNSCIGGKHQTVIHSPIYHLNYIDVKRKINMLQRFWSNRILHISTYIWTFNFQSLKKVFKYCIIGRWLRLRLVENNLNFDKGNDIRSIQSRVSRGITAVTETVQGYQLLKIENTRLTESDRCTM